LSWCNQIEALFKLAIAIYHPEHVSNKFKNGLCGGNRMKVVIVGCTHAGTIAATQILKAHPETEVTVYERNDNISFPLRPAGCGTRPGLI
jgi:hypothetical protein